MNTPCIRAVMACGILAAALLPAVPGRADSPPPLADEPIGRAGTTAEGAPITSVGVIPTGDRHLADTETPRSGKPTVIDVTIAYTERARNEAGGKAAVEALSLLAVRSMNTTLEASGIDVTFRMVKNGQIEFWESRDAVEDLEAVAYSNEAWKLKSWRNTYGSDVAMLLTGRDYGAAAEMPGHYAVVGIAGPGGFSSFNAVVELAVKAWGHNLGAGTVDECGILEDSCAHRQPDALFHTIMSDGAGCPDCLTAPVFSNPEIAFGWLDGVFGGVDLFHGPLTLDAVDPSPVPTGVAGESDNAGTIAGFAPVAAEWRDTIVSGPTCGGLPATWVGTNGDDTYDGTAGRDVIVARAGDDVIRGLGGSDVICGGPGRDELIGGGGDDTLLGGGGDDVLDGQAGRDHLEGNRGRDTLSGGPGDDVLDGGGRNDTIRGGDGDDSAAGGPGKDWIAGEAGDDRLIGGPGRDAINGGSGQDWIQPDPGEPYAAD